MKLTYTCPGAVLALISSSLTLSLTSTRTFLYLQGGDKKPTSQQSNLDLKTNGTQSTRDQEHNWRSDLDLLLINIMKNSSQGGWASEERNSIQLNEPTDIWANVQLAALRTLLASFLSSHFHPRHLAQGLELFRRGNCLNYQTYIQIQYFRERKKLTN